MLNMEEDTLRLGFDRRGCYKQGEMEPTDDS